jgi:hypothetical protein
MAKSTNAKKLKYNQMAKTTTHIQGTEKLSGYAKIFCRSSINAQQIKRLKSDKNPLSQQQQAEMRLKLGAALAGWQTLKTWKKQRWTLCAMFTYGSISLYKCAIGKGGYSLYVAEFLKQNTPSGRQPISPCSRRNTEVTANPWDFTP